MIHVLNFYLLWAISSYFQQLINNLDRDLQYAIRVEGKMDVDFVSNYEEVKSAIMEKVMLGSVVKLQLVLTSNSRILVSQLVIWTK